VTAVNYAAAAYCDANVATTRSTPRTIRCSGTGTDICPAASGAEIIDTFNADSSGSWGFVARSEDSIVVSFRGTADQNDVLNDFKFAQDAVPEICPGCRVHRGFHEGWTGVSSKVLGILATAVEESSPSEIIVTGHSYGAAVAALAAIDIKGANPSIPVSLVSNLPSRSSAFDSDFC
jgi:predicted lipase